MRREPAWTSAVGRAALVVVVVAFVGVLCLLSRVDGAQAAGGDRPSVVAEDAGAACGAGEVAADFGAPQRAGGAEQVPAAVPVHAVPTGPPVPVVSAARPHDCGPAPPPPALAYTVLRI